MALTTGPSSGEQATARRVAQWSEGSQQQEWSESHLGKGTWAAGGSTRREGAGVSHPGGPNMRIQPDILTVSHSGPKVGARRSNKKATLQCPRMWAVNPLILLANGQDLFGPPSSHAVGRGVVQGSFDRLKHPPPLSWLSSPSLACVVQSSAFFYSDFLTHFGSYHL